MNCVAVDDTDNHSATVEIVFLAIMRVLWKGQDHCDACFGIQYGMIYMNASCDILVSEVGIHPTIVLLRLPILRALFAWPAQVLSQHLLFLLLFLNNSKSWGQCHCL